MTLPQKIMQHYAALPYRVGAEGLEVMMVTSRESKRWILPKGRPEKKLLPYKVAELEAYEEAGVRGRVDHIPLGQYHSRKRLGLLGSRPVLITVYALAVHTVLDEWPEKHERERAWMDIAAAAACVRDPELADLLQQFVVPVRT